MAIQWRYTLCNILLGNSVCFETKAMTTLSSLKCFFATAHPACEEDPYIVWWDAENFNNKLFFACLHTYSLFSLLDQRHRSQGARLAVIFPALISTTCAASKTKGVDLVYERRKNNKNSIYFIVFIFMFKKNRLDFRRKQRFAAKFNLQCLWTLI